MSGYGVISDTHHHNWTQFAHTNDQGVNSRLQHTLDETLRAAEWVKKQGGKALIHCGDLFHVRGTVAPSVLNPTLDLYANIIHNLDLPIYILSGNHDLESNNASDLTSAVSALSKVGAVIVNKPHYLPSLGVLMIPWQPSVAALRECVAAFTEAKHFNIDLFIHAPVNGVIAGIPDAGLTPEEVRDWGFRRVFVGHYHNHVAFPGDVFSVGALTHQTFSDIGAKAGFLMVNDDGVQHCPTAAPMFVDVPTTVDEEELRAAIEGNFVRAKPRDFTEEQLKALRDMLTTNGALGVVMHPINSSSAVTRATTSEPGKAVTIYQQVSKFCAESPGAADPLALAAVCQSVLDEVGAPL